MIFPPDNRKPVKWYSVLATNVGGAWLIIMPDGFSVYYAGWRNQRYESIVFRSAVTTVTVADFDALNFKNNTNISQWWRTRNQQDFDASNSVEIILDDEEWSDKYEEEMMESRR